MPLELPQLVFFLFFLAIAIVAYEMKLSLQAPVCAECPHCRARQEAAQRSVEEMQDYYARRFGARRGRDDDDRAP